MGKLEIAAALKSARVYRGLTQGDAAKATNLTYQAISNYERGTNRVDSLTLDKLCSLYKISVESVLDCKEWDDPTYMEDYLHARSDLERKQILQSCGPCPRYICEYNDCVVSEDSKISFNSNELTEFEREVITRLRRYSEEKQRAFLLILTGEDTPEP